MNDVEHNLHVVRQRLTMACLRAGRDPASVQLLLATKTVPAEKIRLALAAGATLLGENRVQEAVQKQAVLADCTFDYHLIGHLQTNKVRDALHFASMIQSVDRAELVEKLDARLQAEGRSLDVLIQVNTSYEASKFGVAPEQAVSFIRRVSTYDTLRIRGLMTIGLFAAEAEQVRPSFRLLRTLAAQTTAEGLPGVQMNTLSMGMSGDLETAVEEGATLIRVGTAVFGPRALPDSFFWNESTSTPNL